jgi:hypothetical protein
MLSPEGEEAGVGFGRDYYAGGVPANGSLRQNIKRLIQWIFMKAQQT